MRPFWKLLPKDLQRHLRVDGNIHNEATFWRTRIAQKEMEALAKARDGACCYECRLVERLINDARSSR